LPELLTTARRQLGTLGHAGQRLPALLASRVVEQCVIGLASLLLAARLGPAEFAPVSVLLIANSAAVTLSDWGVGLSVLRRAPGEHVARRSLTGMRLANLTLLAGGVLAGIAVGGTTGVVLVASATIWWSTAEAYLAKAAAINVGDGHRAAVAEIVGSVVFIVPVVAVATADAAVVVVGAALVAKHLAEALVAGRPGFAFAANGARPELGAMWGTQMLAFLVGNADYVVVALVLGAEAFSIYSVGYRVAVAIPSVVAYAATRTSLADLGAAGSPALRQTRFLAYVRPLFALGVAGAVVAATVGAVLPGILGAGWDGLAATIAVLAVAAPWRMVFGQAGALTLVARRSHALVVRQVVQLVGFVALGVVAALVGYGTFVAMTTCCWIVSVTLMTKAASDDASIRGWPALPSLALLGIAVVVTVAVVLPW